MTTFLTIRLLSFFLLAAPLVQEDEMPDGIFIIQPPSKKKIPCENELSMVVGGLKVCVSKRPIISADEVEFVTDIRWDAVLKKHYFDVGLSSAGVQTLNKTFNSLPTAKFAFVRHKQVMCVIQMYELMQSHRSFRVGLDLIERDLYTLHGEMKKGFP